MRDRIKQVMADIFVIRPDELPDDGAMGDVPQWDSLRHLELMLALEMEFGIPISAVQMLELVSLEVIEQYLVAHGIPGS